MADVALLYGPNGQPAVWQTGANTTGDSSRSMILVGGLDSTTARALLLDSSGRQVVAGAAADGAAVAGNPVRVAGSDGTNTQDILTDTTGRQVMVGAAAAGAALAGNPVLVAGSDGTDARSLLTDSTGKLVTTQTTQFEELTYSVLATSVALGNGKSMLSLLNVDATLKVKVREVWVMNVQTAGVTGVITTFELRRFTGHSAGSSLTPNPYDDADTLDSDITARTGGTITGEGVLLWRQLWSSDEWGPGTLDEEGAEHGLQTVRPFWSATTPQKPITLGTNKGLHLKCATNTTAGTFDVFFVFTVA